MSWSINRYGTKGGVAQAVAIDLDKIAENYKGTPEADDVFVVKQRVLSAIDSIDYSPSPYGGTGTAGVKVEASGSRGSYGTNITINVQRIALEI